MIFTPGHVRLIATGRKTQTRRIVGDWDFTTVLPDAPIEWVAVKKPGCKSRTKWRFGHNYAVTAGRTLPTAMWWRREDGNIEVHNWNYIGGRDTRWREVREVRLAAGWHDLRIRILSIRHERLRDISEEDARAEGYASVEAFAEAWDTINDRKGRRWTDNLFVWPLEFEVVT